MPNPGTAITWTIGGGNSWVLGAVRVVAAPNCGVAAGNCYRIGAGGAWNTGANWSDSAGGASCACTPVASNQAIFNASPSGTITLAAATTIASIDMTGFTGTLDTTGSNWALAINGAFLIQGTFNAHNSTVSVTGNVSILTAATVVLLGASTWTINGNWTNQSTAAGWTAGTSSVTIQDAANGTLTFAALAGAANEFSNLTLDASVTTSVTYTMATNALRMSGTLTILNSTGGATGWSVLTTSGANLGITVGGLAVSTFGALIANASAISINGNVNIGAANGYLVMNSSTWTITGTWTNASTSATWGAGTGTVTFNSATGGTMTFAGANLSGSEFNNITFDSSAASAQTFTMSTRALNWAGTLIVSDGSSTTALATANLGFTGGALNVGNGGILTANASTFTVSSVTMTGGRGRDEDDQRQRQHRGHRIRQLRRGDMDLQRLLDELVDERIVVCGDGHRGLQFRRFPDHDIRQSGLLGVQQCAIQPDRGGDVHDGHERASVGRHAHPEQQCESRDREPRLDGHRRQSHGEQRCHVDDGHLHRERSQRDDDGRDLRNDHRLRHVGCGRELGHLGRRLHVHGAFEHRDDERGGHDRQDPELVEWIRGSHHQRYGIRRLGNHHRGLRDREWHARHDGNELWPHDRRRADG